MGKTTSTGTGTGRTVSDGSGRLQGVKCDVRDCKYNCAVNCCGASNISVENPNAHNKAETFCSTFSPRAE